MRIIIKDVKIPTLDDKSEDILIENGILKKPTTSDCDQLVEGKDLVLLPSFTDIGTFNGEPGYEERETLETLSSAACAGGFSELLLLPLTDPPVDHATAIKNILRSSGLNGVDFSPLGSVSSGNKGGEIAELFEMIEAGAVGFTDGYASIQSAGLMIRALDYVKRFESVIVNMPHDQTVSPDGVVHEGNMSTRMGMQGIPGISETLMLQRDIDLADYTDSRLHVWNITDAESVKIIRDAKERGLNVSCSVSYLHLLETDAAIADYNETFKIHPPLRSEQDRQALIEGILDSTIDCITSLHRPWNEEKKNLEFSRSAVGAAGLETMFPALWSKLDVLRDWEVLNRTLNINPRGIFGLEPKEIVFDKRFNGTLIDTGSQYTFDESQIMSKSKNYPYIGEDFIVEIIQLPNEN